MNRSLRAQIDKYFKGHLGGDDASAMFESLIGDDEATQYFERRRLLAETDPDARGAQDRIALSLGLPTQAPAAQTAGLRTLLAPLMGVAAAAAALLFLVVPGGEGDGFSPRGGGDQPTITEQVMVFRVAGEGSEVVRGAIDKGDELAFAYRNPQGRQGLMVYGVDEAGEVYWYHPAWTDPADNPQAIPLEKSEDLVELTEAVTHDIGGQHLKIYGLFVDEPTTVRQIETALSRGPLEGARLLADVDIRGETP